MEIPVKQIVVTLDYGNNQGVTFRIKDITLDKHDFSYFEEDGKYLFIDDGLDYRTKVIETFVLANSSEEVVEYVKKKCIERFKEYFEHKLSIAQTAINILAEY